MRAVLTAVVIAEPRQPKAKRIRFRLWRKRQEPTLFQRCLAVHVAQTGTLSALK